MKILFAWIGLTDLRAADKQQEAGLGPIGQVVNIRHYDRILLLNNFEDVKSAKYRDWLKDQTSTPFDIKGAKLSSPTEFGEIYQKAIENILEIKAKYPDSILTFHLSPGTPAMAAVWVILAKTRFPAELIESSREAGVRTVSVPFEITAEFIPDLMRQSDEHLEKSSNKLSIASEFKDIIYQSPQMAEVIELAQSVALHNVPVLIEGESGTGKELFAKAIHQSSSRNRKSFVPVNCGAIPPELIESELFGHKKGSFTGAVKDYDGAFKSAQSGTIFLDEVGELPLRAQVRLLRVLQEKEITPVGESKPQKIDVRIISATNRNLLQEVSSGRFREDLFFRLAVYPLFLPPLRNRTGDLELLIDYFLRKLNEENTEKFWRFDKTLTADAKSILLKHRWIGNVRELQNTILRISIRTKKTTITESDVRQGLFEFTDNNNESILNRPLGNGFSLPNLLDEVAKIYLDRALEAAGQNKTKASQLVGLANYQTLDNWLKKLN